MTPRYLSLSITDSVTSHCITLTLLGSTIKLQEPFRRQETGDSHRTSTHHWHLKTKRRVDSVFTPCSLVSSHLARPHLDTLLARVFTPCSPVSAHLARQHCPRLHTSLALVFTPCSPASSHLARPRLHTLLVHDEQRCPAHAPLNGRPSALKVIAPTSFRSPVSSHLARPHLHTLLARIFTPCSSLSSHLAHPCLHTLLAHVCTPRSPASSLIFAVDSSSETKHKVLVRASGISW